MLNKIINNLKKDNFATKDELLYLLKNLDENSKEKLLMAARSIREDHYSTKVYMRGLIEFSNYCKQNCVYCGIRRDNKNADRYRLTNEQIMECCRLGWELGYKTFVLQSGEDNYYSDEKLVEMIENIKSEFPESAVTLSLGERSYESYEKFYKAGADRYLLRHETASKELYEKLHPEMSFEQRKKCLFDLKEIGYQVGAGFMVGLPEQNDEDLVKDLMFLKELEPEMVGIGPYLNHPDTPLKDSENGSLEKTLIMLALVRLLLPDVLLPATTAMGTIHNYGREKALLAGGNVVMPNLSPTEVREKYELYSDKICTGDLATHCRKCIEGRINSVGYKVDLSRGDHKNWRRLDV